MALTPAVFFDKDGTLVDDVPYNSDPARLRLAPGAGAALRLVRRAGYKVVVVTNQSGVARGFLDEAAVLTMQRVLAAALHAEGAAVDAFYSCPHHPDGVVPGYAKQCDCRKPAPGMLLRAAREHALDLSRSWLVGDILDDVEAGNRAGCRTVLLDAGNETIWELTGERLPTQMAADLGEAAAIILAAAPHAVTKPRRRRPAGRASP